MKPIANMSITGLTHTEAIHQAEVVHTKSSAHPLFQQYSCPSHLVTLDDLGLAITNTKTALMDSSTRDTLKLAHLGVCRHNLNDTYYYFGRYAEILTRDKPTVLVDGLGFPLAQTNSTVKGPVLLVAPSNPALQHGPDHSIIARIDRPQGALTFEGQFTLDQTFQSGWCLPISFGSAWRGMVFPNLTPGQVYAFRFRAIFRSGPGPWSVIVTLMAI